MKFNKKIGTLNLTWLNDYGAILIAYANQKILKDKGYSSESINYFPSKPNKRGEVPSIHTEERMSSKLKIENFNSFRKKYLKFSKDMYIGTSINKIEHYDLILVGSDTLWTPFSLLHLENPRNYSEYYFHFLKFAQNSKTIKMAWSCSIGSNNKNDLCAMKPIFKKELKNFDYISIREKDTAKYIQSLTDKPVYNICDPVLNLDINDFDEILPNKENNHDYIYCFLFEDYKNNYETINKVSEKMSLPVIANVKHPQKIKNLLKNCEDDGPGDFVQRIKNSSIVITDSYHAIILSILAKKNFISIPRTNINIRETNLLTMFNLSNKLFLNNSDPIEILDKKIDWYYIDNIIKTERLKTNNYLKQVL